MTYNAYIHEQHRNWDGGGQEYNAAADCIKSVFPDAPITGFTTTKYPIRVTIHAYIGETKTKIWTGKQQTLFQKNASERTKSIEEITTLLQELKKDL